MGPSPSRPNSWYSRHPDLHRHHSMASTSPTNHSTIDPSFQYNQSRLWQSPRHLLIRSSTDLGKIWYRTPTSKFLSHGVHRYRTHLYTRVSHQAISACLGHAFCFVSIVRRIECHPATYIYHVHWCYYFQSFLGICHHQDNSIFRSRSFSRPRISQSSWTYLGRFPDLYHEASSWTTLPRSKFHWGSCRYRDHSVSL